MSMASYIYSISQMSTEDLVDEVIDRALAKDYTPEDKEMYHEAYSLLKQKIRDLENAYDASM